MPRVSEAHRAARREQIVAASMRCFHANGFHPTTMDDIVRESGLSAGAVYTYFRSKDELILAAGLNKLGALWATIDNLVAADPFPTPAQAVQTIVDRVVEITVVGDLDLSRIIVFGWGETTRNTELREAVQRAYHHFADGATALIDGWRTRGVLPAHVDAAQAAPALVSFMLGFIVQRAVVGPIDPDAYARGAAALLGAATPAGPAAPAPTAPAPGPRASR